jgi:hypothetical protein
MPEKQRCTPGSINVTDGGNGQIPSENGKIMITEQVLIGEFIRSKKEFFPGTLEPFGISTEIGLTRSLPTSECIQHNPYNLSFSVHGSSGLNVINKIKVFLF